jgi:hypothetical protein
MRTCSQSRHNNTVGGTALALAMLGLIAASSAGCDDDDTTSVTPHGGSGGAAGRAGGGGRGGTGGGRGGMAGGGAGGTAGTGDGDAGVNPDAGDAAAPLTAQEQIVTDLCAKLALFGGERSTAGDAGLDAGTGASCPPADSCVQDYLGTFTFVEQAGPDCLDEAEAYFACIAAQPVTSFECSNGTPQLREDAVTCDDEETAFLLGINSSPPSCPD